MRDLRNYDVGLLKRSWSGNSFFISSALDITSETSRLQFQQRLINEWNCLPSIVGQEWTGQVLTGNRHAFAATLSLRQDAACLLCILCIRRHSLKMILTANADLRSRAAPAAWNALPLHVHELTDSVVLQNNLNVFYFAERFSIPFRCSPTLICLISHPHYFSF